MKKMLVEAKSLLEKERASLVLIREGQEPHIDFRSGLIPLWEAYRDGNWSGGVLADRVIGRGAAFLAVDMELISIYSPLMSRGAVEIFKKWEIEFKYELQVERIRDRSGKGLCPMEALLEGIEESHIAIQRLNQFFLERKGG